MWLIKPNIKKMKEWRNGLRDCLKYPASFIKGYSLKFMSTIGKWRISLQNNLQNLLNYPRSWIKGHPLKFMLSLFLILYIFAFSFLIIMMKTQAGEPGFGVLDAFLGTLPAILGELEPGLKMTGSEGLITAPAIFCLFLNVCLIGIIISWATNYLCDLTSKGGAFVNKVDYENHIVICGWNYQGDGVIDALKEMHPSKKIAVLANLEKRPVERGDVVCLQGSPLNEEDLERAGVNKAKSVIILTAIGGDKSRNPDSDALNITTLIRNSVETKKLFSWDNVPKYKKDKEQLLKYLWVDRHIGWAEKAEISKSEDGKTICIFGGDEKIEITLDEKLERATLKISDDETYDLKVKEESCKLNIYEQSKRRAHISVQLLHSQNEKHLEEAGANTIVCLDKLGGSILAFSAEYHGILKILKELLFTREGSEIYKQKIPDEYIGKNFREVGKQLLDKKMILVAIETEDVNYILKVHNKEGDYIQHFSEPSGKKKVLVVNPQADYVLRENDFLFIISEKEPTKL